MHKLLVLILISVNSFAYEIDMKGFLTFSYMISDSEIPYEDNVTSDGEFSNGTSAGLQFSSVLNSKVDVFMQVLAEGDDGRDFNFALDIAHINYHMSDDHSILYGKIRLPVYMISDYQLVGSLYPWVNPPDEVYELAPLEDIGANNTFFGVSFEGNLFVNALKDFKYRLYAGGSERVTEKENANGTNEIRIKNLQGVHLSYTNEDNYYMFNYLNVNSEGERFDFDLDAYLPSQKFRTQYFSFGNKYDNDNILFMTEVSHVISDTKENRQLDSYYVLLGKYFSDSEVLAYVTYADVLSSTKSNRDPHQHSVILGLNYNLDLSTVLKFELKNITVEKDPKTNPMGDIRPAGFFVAHPEEDVKVLSVSINSMF